MAEHYPNSTEKPAADPDQRQAAQCGTLGDRPYLVPAGPLDHPDFGARAH